MDRKYALPILGTLLLAIGLYLYLRKEQSPSPSSNYATSAGHSQQQQQQQHHDASLDVRKAKWAREIAESVKMDQAAVPLEAPGSKLLKDDFQKRLQEAAAQDEKVTPISIDFDQYVENETAATRTFPLYTSKSIDAFISPYFATQANLGAADKAYYRAQTF